TAITRYLEAHKNTMYDWFMRALKSDIHDTQGGTTPEGIHTGVMAGTLDIIFKGFAGVNLFKKTISIDPFLPKAWFRLKFIMQHRGNCFEIDITREQVKVKAMMKNKDKQEIIEVGEQSSVLSDSDFAIFKLK
ncbi:MAG: glycosyl hydrolase family 65 protein, partial [Spirochaetota bacterium]